MKKNTASTMKSWVLLPAVFLLYACTQPWQPMDSQRGSLKISLSHSTGRGLGLVVPSPVLSDQITSYRLTVGTEVRAGLALTDLASQTGLPAGVQNVLVEGLKGTTVIMNHTPVSLDLQPGVLTPLTLNLQGLQTGAANAFIRLRFYLDPALGLGPDGPISQAEYRLSSTLAGLSTAPAVSLGAPQYDGVNLKEYLEITAPDYPSGRMFMKLRFLGQTGTAFAYSPILTLDLYDGADHNLTWTLTAAELDGKPLAPSAPDDPLVPGNTLPVAAPAHDGTFLTLTWKDNSWVEEGFRIYRKLDTDTAWTEIDTVPANVTTWSETADGSGNSITGLLRDKNYHYRIAAYTPQYVSGIPLEVGPLTTSPKAVIYTGPNQPAAWGSTIDKSSQHTEIFQVGTTAPWEDSLALSNEGFWPLSLENVTIGGDNPGDYTFSTPNKFFDLDWITMDTGPARSVQTFPQKVNAGDVLFVKVTWNPTAPGIRKTTFTFETDDPLLLPVGTGNNTIIYQDEAVSINDYVGRWDVDPSLGVGNFTGTYPTLFRANLGSAPSSTALQIGGNVSTVADRYSVGPTVDMASFNMAGGNGTDYMQVQTGNPFDLDGGGTITMWTGMYFPKAGETWTLLDTMNLPTGATVGFRLELTADASRSLNWRLQVAGQSDFVQSYAGELDTRWNLLSLSYEPATTTFILRVNQTEVFQAVRTMVHTAGDPIGWGSRPSDPAINHINHWKGSLDDLRIYSRVLSTAELDLLRQQNSTFNGNPWGKDITAPPSPVSAGVNRLVTDGTGHRAYFHWDLSNQPPGEPFMVQVEMTIVTPPGPTWYARMGIGDLTKPWEDKVFSDPAFTPGVGTVLDYTFRVMDREGNLSGPVTQTNRTVTALGDPLGGAFSLGLENLNINSSSFLAVADSGVPFDLDTTNPSEAFTGAGDIIHGALGENAVDKSELVGMGKDFVTVFLWVNPTGRIATVEWLLDGGTPVLGGKLVSPVQNPSNDVVYTPANLIGTGLDSGLHTLTLRITTTDGLIYSGYASFEVKE